MLYSLMEHGRRPILFKNANCIICCIVGNSISLDTFPGRIPCKIASELRLVYRANQLHGEDFAGRGDVRLGLFNRQTLVYAYILGEHSGRSCFMMSDHRHGYKIVLQWRIKKS